MSYAIEEKPISKNGYYTPAESNSQYATKYDRRTYITHWYGAPGQVGTHDQTVAYIQGQANAGNMSLNYVVSDEKITMLVPPDMVSWGAGPKGNPIGVNVEHSPYLSDEGYKKAGWLKWQLEQRWNKRLGISRHNDYMQTACPGTIDIDRIEAECERWRAGFSNAPAPQPTPQPTPSNPQGVVEMINTREEAIVAYKLLRPNYNPNQDEINSTAGKRSWLQFVNDGIREREQRDAALAAQSQALVSAQNEAQTLRSTITQIQQVEAQEDITEAQKDKQLADLGGKLSDTSNALSKALLEVERLNGLVYKVPEKTVPDTFGWFVKLLSLIAPKPKS